MNEFQNLQSNTKSFILVLLIAIIYAIYYLVKNFERTEFQLKIIIIILIVGFGFGIFRSINDDNNMVVLANNFLLTSGKIKKYYVPNLKGGLPSSGISSSPTSIKYTYLINDIEIENAYSPDYFISLPDEKPDLSIEYLVMYEKNNPKNSLILLNYPINKKNDLEKYKKKFENGIPDNVFKNGLE